MLNLNQAATNSTQKMKSHILPLVVFFSAIVICCDSMNISAQPTPFYDTGFTSYEVQSVADSYCAALNSSDQQDNASCKSLAKKAYGVLPKGGPRPKPCGDVANCKMPKLQGAKAFFIPGKVVNPIITFYNESQEVVNNTSSINLLETQSGWITLIALEEAVAGKGVVHFNFTLEDTGKQIKFSRSF